MTGQVVYVKRYVLQGNGIIEAAKDYCIYRHYGIDVGDDRIIFFGNFDMFYNLPMNSAALYPTTDVIDTYVYRSLKVMGDLGMSSAAGLYQSVVGFVIVIVANAVIRKTDKESALF